MSTLVRVTAKLCLKPFIIRTVFKILTCIHLLRHLGGRYWQSKGTYKFICKETTTNERTKLEYVSIN